jgi:hypothetical protein
MKKITAAILIAISTASHAGVLKCMVNRTTFVTTNAQYCPDGTVFDSILPGSNVNIAAQAESARIRQNMQNQAARPSCETLRARRDLINARLRNNDKESGLLQKSADAHDDLIRSGCSSY